MFGVHAEAEVVQQRLERQRAFFNGLLERGQALLLERLTSMAPAERAAYAARLQDNLEKRWSNTRRERE